MYKYKEGAIVNGVEVIETWVKRYPNSSSSWGQFICPYCFSFFECSISSIKGSNKPKSCGCKSGGIGGLSDHKVHAIWVNLKERCFNPNRPKYKDYGGRGITVQENWKTDFKAFFDYVTNLPNYPGEEGLGKGEGKLTLDRIENNGNYEEGNLRWATAKVQRNNQRRNSKEKVYV